VIIRSQFNINKIFLGVICTLLLTGCAQLTYYSLEDVEKQRLEFKNGEEKSLRMLTKIYQDRNQSYDVRLAAMRALSESRDPTVIKEIQGSVRNASLIELDLMQEAIQILISYKELSSTDSLIAALNATEKKSLEIRKSILKAIGENGTKDEVKLLIKLYDVSKRNNAQMNQLLAETLGDIGDEKVIPILMEIASNKNLPVNIRSRSVEILSKKQTPELVDFFIEMLGDPVSRDKVNEYALNVMGELSEERMILALLEAYQVGRHEYYSLLNTVINGLDNFENPEIKTIYKEIAITKDFPSNIRLKAFKGLIRFSDDPETVDEVITLLNDPSNYVYYNEIIGMLQAHGVYENYQDKLRMAAFKAMKKDVGLIGMTNE